jgi:hypothetical protein
VRAAPQAEEHPAQTKTRSSKSLQATQTDDDNIVQPIDGHDGIADSFTTLGLHAHDSTAADNESEGK